MEVAAATGVKNPDDMRIVSSAITLWILRCAQNDSSRILNTVSVNPLYCMKGSPESSLAPRLFKPIEDYRWKDWAKKCYRQSHPTPWASYRWANCRTNFPTALRYSLRRIHYSGQKPPGCRQ